LGALGSGGRYHGWGSHNDFGIVGSG
jgi:hypothetical protein